MGRHAFATGLGSRSITRLVMDGKGGAKAAERWDIGKRIRDITEAPDGTLWLLEDGKPRRPDPRHTQVSGLLRFFGLRDCCCWLRNCTVSSSRSPIATRRTWL